jgi:hypothetical protein
MRRIVQTTDSASGGLHVHKQSMTIAIAGASANRHFAAPCDRFYLNKLLHAAQLHQHLIAHLQSDCVFDGRSCGGHHASSVGHPYAPTLPTVPRSGGGAPPGHGLALYLVPYDSVKDALLWMSCCAALMATAGGVR